MDADGRYLSANHHFQEQVPDNPSALSGIYLFRSVMANIGDHDEIVMEVESIAPNFAVNPPPPGPR